MKKDLAPVVVIAYTRIETLRKSLRNLASCIGVEKRDVYLYLDAPYREQDIVASNAINSEAECIRKAMLPNMTIIRREKNYGVPGNLIAAVTEIVNKYGKVICFEDDILLSRTFLEYQDAALEKYESDTRIWGINGFQRNWVFVPKSYNGDVYLTPRLCPWGWGTWANRWNAVDFELRNFSAQIVDGSTRKRVDDSGLDMYKMLKAVSDGVLRTWDVQCVFYMVQHGMLCVEPKYSLTKNIGYGRDSLHCGYNAYLAKRRYYNFRPILSAKINPDNVILKMVKTSNYVPRVSLKRFIRFIIKLLWSCKSDNLEPVNI